MNVQGVHMLFRYCCTLLLLLASSGTMDAHAQTSDAPSLAPGALAVYYGWPSLVNGAGGDVDAAVDTFDDYQVVVFGFGLQDPTHPDHAPTRTIIARLKRKGVAVYGYITLGVSTVNHPVATLKQQIDAWKAAGVSGIFLDEGGYDFGVTRARQNVIVNYVHGRRLSAFMNAWFPEDVFSDSVVAVYNPKGLATRLGPNDLYLCESYQIRFDAYAPVAAWQQRAERVAAYRAQYGTRVATVTTTALGLEAFAPEKHTYAFYATLLYGFDFYGWGEEHYSSVESRLPWRARPEVAPGTAFLSTVQVDGTTYTRQTDAGTLLLDAATHTATFTPGTSDALAQRGATTTAAEVDAARPFALDLAPAFPNPATHATSFAVATPEAQHVRIEVLNMLGQQVAVLHDGVLTGGAAHTFTFEVGGEAPGLYLYRVRGERTSAVGTFVVVR